MIIVNNNCGCDDDSVYKIVDLSSNDLASVTPNVPVTTVDNVGSGTTITTSGSTGSTLQFKTLVAGENIQLEDSGMEITISASGVTPLHLFNSFTGATSTGGTSTFDGNRAITRSTINGVNAGGSTVVEFLNNLFFPAVAPSASLSGGGTRLYGNNDGLTLSYVATRNTNLIASIVIDGDTITLTNGGESQSGTKAETLDANNTNKTFSMTVTDVNGLTDTATASVTFSHKRYWFGSATDLIGGSDAAISTAVNAGTSEFSSSKAKSSFTMTLANAYFYYVYPASLGTASFNINGLSNTDFSTATFTLTNSEGYDHSFRIYRTNNLLSGSFTFSVS